MKKIFLMTFLTALALNMRAADYPYLTFTLTDGTTQSIQASNLSLSFSDGQLKATSGSTTLTITLTDLAKMEFSTDGSSTTAIQGIDTSVMLDEATEVYDLNGRRLPSVSNLSRGTYIIKSNGKTTKVQVR